MTPLRLGIAVGVLTVGINAVVGVTHPFVQMPRFLLPKLLLASCMALGTVSSVLLPEVRALAAPSRLARQSFVADAVARSGPAVVTLETARTVERSALSGLPPGLLRDPLFRRFFQAPGSKSQSRVQRGQGSGVIFDAKGLLLTNAHVVEGAETLSVELTDGRRVTGAVVGTDSLTDLAVVRLDGEGPWPTAVLGDSDRLRVGDWAIAVGNPFGLENTVTMGIISNLNRNVSQLGISGKRLDLIQTDAAINPGNSGGPLLNADGEVVGINTLVRSGPGAGLGFAIPINRAQTIARQLVATGRASHPVIGIGLADGPDGPVIRSVQPGAPAAKAGLKPDDEIAAIDGQPMRGAADVVAAIDRKGVGQRITLTIRRGKARLTVKLKPMDLADLKS